ncbi:CpaD family pilus assembly protein [Bradyrhizobium sp. AZCC 1721]|uniref:CpaD family pilus assembly protein n=1 Tax=Bradyrhizobium sp. AZCC 1721 TaxID=3117016 RepID=UPI003FA552DB
MTRTPLHRVKAGGLLGALLGLSATLGACTWQSTEIVTTASVSDDYRHRHPIAVTEADHSIVVFVGRGRGGLSGPQRADVMGLAQAWMREGTGVIIADVPIDTANARAAASSYQEIRSVLLAGGVPSRAITRRHYHPDDIRALPTIRLSYPKIKAVAGPCGLWPQDLGPNIDNVAYNENRSYHNFGCATQRNLAAMVDNPADLEQPRPETAAYTPRRDIAFDKYRKGASTATSYPEADKAKLSDTGK